MPEGQPNPPSDAEALAFLAAQDMMKGYFTFFRAGVDAGFNEGQILQMLGVLAVLLDDERAPGCHWLMARAPQSCIHSNTESDCASCWYRNYYAMLAQESRLRALIDDYADADVRLLVAGHDKFWLGGNAGERSRRLYDRLPDVPIPHPVWEDWLPELLATAYKR